VRRCARRAAQCDALGHQLTHALPRVWHRESSSRRHAHLAKSLQTGVGGAHTGAQPIPSFAREGVNGARLSPTLSRSSSHCALGSTSTTLIASAVSARRRTPGGVRTRLVPALASPLDARAPPLRAASARQRTKNLPYVVSHSGRYGRDPLPNFQAISLSPGANGRGEKPGTLLLLAS
jgi:hypothetical protein